VNVDATPYETLNSVSILYLQAAPASRRHRAPIAGHPLHTAMSADVDFTLPLVRSLRFDKDYIQKGLQKGCDLPHINRPIMHTQINKHINDK